ncbi:MAG TPA: Uma2 family endonuclease [Pyrinomonadaceae bacterium]|nr:Uma2 family endonuclease [Pyrinomonadaceae bacterium]
MNTRVEATIEDLYEIEGKAELVNGEIVHMPPTGGLLNLAARQILFSLADYEKRTKSGVAVSDNAAFVVNLPHRKSFSPDAAFYKGEVTMNFFEGAPVFAVEVRSKGDYGPKMERKLATKRADYFAAGTQVVWDVDLSGTDVIRSFYANDPQHPKLFRRGETADAEPALPGWRMPVDDLFPQKD